MRANEFLTELFTGSKNWKWVRNNPNEVMARFEIGGVPYKFIATCEDIDGEGPWEVEFANNLGTSREERFGTTGTGNSAEVMSTVVDIMREFLKKHQHNITELVFSAKESSRKGLYARMVQRLLPDWELDQAGDTFILTPPYDLDEEVLDEMPLPADWDPQQMRQQGTTFKSRLAYALERAKKLGTGSSRVATTIEYQGRPTVLKIAKNAKGLAQNSVEADILSDGYASQLGILIPIIDYDEQNREPSWIHTEMATKASDKKLASLMGTDSLNELVILALAISGKARRTTYQGMVDGMRQKGKTDEQIEKATEYANVLADLTNSFDIELGDLNRAANWGLYQGKPVIVDAGANSNVLSQYYSK